MLHHARRHLRLLAVLALLLLFWAVLHATGWRHQIGLQSLQDGFQRHIVIGGLVFTALFVLGNLAQVPGWLFLVAAVLALGPWWGGAVTYGAACLSSVVTYGLVRLMGGNALRSFDGRISRRLFARLDADPVPSVLVLRLLFQTLPALNYALALSGVRFRHYLTGTLLGLPLPIAVGSALLRTLAGWLQWPLPA